MNELTKQITKLNSNIEKLISLMESNSNLASQATMVLSEVETLPSNIMAISLSPHNTGLRHSTRGSVKVVDVLESHPDSSCISKIRYNPKKEELKITFKTSNKTYAYKQIGKDLFEEFINSNSLGRFHNRNLRHRWTQVK